MIALINTGLGNTNSVRFALERLGLKHQLTVDPYVIQTATQVILPGVGHAKAGMRRLQALGLVETIRGLRQPTIGICLGMQLLFDSSEEGDVLCLGVIPGRVKALRGSDSEPIPHMGWNSLSWPEQEEFNKNYFYFVHSFAVEPTSDTLASCYYTENFTAIVQKENFVGIQFHPEKSGPIGEKLLMHFLKENP